MIVRQESSLFLFKSTTEGVCMLQQLRTIKKYDHARTKNIGTSKHWKKHSNTARLYKACY
jgi:hypothetical protein